VRLPVTGIVLATALAIAWPSSSAATGVSDAPAAIVARWVQQGRALFAAGRYADARDTFIAAYRETTDPRFLIDIADCHRALGGWESALRYYRAYLDEQPQAKNRGYVERRIAEVEALARGGAAVPAPVAPPPATASPPPATTSAPPAIATAPAPAEAANEAVAVESAPVVSEAPATPTKPVWKRWWVWTIAGGAAAGLAIGLGVGLTPHDAAVPSTVGGYYEPRFP